jgi:outer membrane autotransporter protein
MKSNFTNKLLLGAAVTALSLGAAAGAQAQTLAGNSTYGLTAPVDTPTAGNNINLNSFDLLINNTSNVAIGAITDTGTPADGNVSIVTSAAADLTQTIGSLATGSGNFAINNSANDGDVTVNVTGAMSVGGTLVVSGANVTTSDVVALTVGGNTTVTGTTAITGGAIAGGGATTTVTLNGATNTFTGAVTVTGGAGNATNDATLVLSGASNTFTGGLTLTDGAAGQALLLVNGTTAQTVTGTIAGDGDITVTNAAGATFNGTVATGTITVNNSAALNSAATFTNTVNSAGAITLGGTGTGANTITFNTTGQSFAVTGALTGAAAGETNTVTVNGGNTLTLNTATAADNNIDVINVTGTGTVLTSGQNIQAAAINVGSGATIRTTGNTITGPIANTGTIQMNGGNVTGAVTGTGTLAVNNTGTLTGAITQGAATIAAGATLNRGGAAAYNVGTTTFTGAGATLALVGGAQTITGNFTNTTDGHGAITVADVTGTVAFVGNVGASVNNSLASYTVAAGGNNVLTTSTGNWFVDATTLGAGDTLQFIGTSAQTASGTIAGGGVGQGALTVGNGTGASNVTFNGIFGGTTLASVTTNTLSSATFNENVTTAGAFTVGGTATVAQGKTVTADNYGAGGGAIGTINLVIGTTGVGGTDQSATLASGNAIDYELLNGTTANGARLNLTQGTGVITNNQVFTIVDGTGAVTNLTAAPVAVNNTFALYNFTVRTGDNAFFAGSDNSQILAIASVDRTAGGTVTGQANQSTADGILSISAAQYAAADQNFKNVYDSVTRADSSQINDRLDSLRPDVDASGLVAVQSMAAQTANITNQQLASLRDGTQTGAVAGNISNGLRVWGQVFGQTADQDRRDGIAGYDADTLGLAIGIDTAGIADNWIWGLGFAYAETDVKSEGANRTKTDIDSYQLSLYANYDVDDRTYLAGQVGYIWSDNDQTRHNLGGVTGLNATSDYDSDVIFARLEAGRNYNVGTNTILTPKALINYQHYDVDGYTERGAGGAGLVVGSESLDILELGVGVDARWDLRQADGSFLQPKLSAGVRHDVIGDEYATTNRFIATGGSFRTEGFDPAQTTFNVGAGVTYFSTTNWELSAGYDYEFKSDYDAHSGTLRAAYKF